MNEMFPIPGDIIAAFFRNVIIPTAQANSLPTEEISDEEET